MGGGGWEVEGGRRGRWRGREEEGGRGEGGGLCVCGRGEEEGSDNEESAVSDQERIYRAPNSTSSTGHQCHHLAESVRTHCPAATGLWRLTQAINQPLCEEKG